jgi:hypothetical protein
MKSQRRIAIVCTAAAALVVSGCSSLSSTAQRAGITAVGSALGAGGGYVVGDKKPGAMAAGAVIGAAVAELAQGEDPGVRQAGFDEGYVRGQSDAIKRQYFLRKQQEAQPPAGASQDGESVYYVVPGPATTWDGRKLEPHQVAVRVVE